MICEFPSIKKEILVIEKKKLVFQMDNDDAELSIIGPIRFFIESNDTFGMVFDEFVEFVKSKSDLDNFYLIYDEDKYKEKFKDQFFTIRNIKVYEVLKDISSYDTKQSIIEGYFNSIISIIEGYFNSIIKDCFKASYKK